jgi:membrane protease YdiL (CAAX protease family)
MSFLAKQFQRSPVVPRVAPFALFITLTFCQGQFGEASRYWFYAAKTGVGVWLLWIAHPWIPEMKWRFSWEAVAAGIAVFVLWVGIDAWYPGLADLNKRLIAPLLGRIGLGSPHPSAAPAAPWNPHAYFGEGTPLASSIIVIRIAGSTLVVPPLEEVFYRSFLYRYLAQPDFQSMPLGEFRWRPFLLTAVIFGFAHEQWLAGILCAFIYQGLVCWKNRLGDAIVAHAITNFLLGMWVVWKDAWNFW